MRSPYWHLVEKMRAAFFGVRMLKSIIALLFLLILTVVSTAQAGQVIICHDPWLDTSRGEQNKSPAYMGINIAPQFTISIQRPNERWVTGWDPQQDNVSVLGLSGMDGFQETISGLFEGGESNSIYVHGYLSGYLFYLDKSVLGEDGEFTIHFIVYYNSGQSNGLQATCLSGTVP